MKLKKARYFLMLGLTTLGASIIISFLSFSGMFVLVPLVSVALSSFALSVIYEAEIYKQNIQSAFNKLFKWNYLKHYLATKYLSSQFPDTTDANCPQFFKDYAEQFNKLSVFGHKRLNEASALKKKQIERKLHDMENWFALQLFGHEEKEEHTNKFGQDYKKSLQEWLHKHKQEKWKTRLNNRHRIFNLLKLFSTLASIFMGLGITYLLVEAFAAIPFLAAIPFSFLPAIIIPMALISGVAYGFLVYNAATDMINNKTFRSWYKKIREAIDDDLRQKGFIGPRTIFIFGTSLILLSLTIALTVCTAFTWWTIAKNSTPLLSWMGKLPSVIMGVVNPIITGFSQLIFNLQNTSESLTLIDEATKNNPLQIIKKSYAHLRETENWLQIFNPFRIALKLTVTPLRLAFFFGHLISIGVTADRVPGVPEVISAILGIVCEGFEDMHYFLDDLFHTHHHEHSTFKERLKEHFSAGHGHNHDADLPTYVLKHIFYPLYALAARWDSWASQNNEKPKKVLSLDDAWYKQFGEKKIKAVETTDAQLSAEWQIRHTNYRIDRFIDKHLKSPMIINEDLAKKEIKELKLLQKMLQQQPNIEAMRTCIQEESSKALYTQQRFFDHGVKKFLEQLPEKTLSAAPAA